RSDDGGRRRSARSTNQTNRSDRRDQGPSMRKSGPARRGGRPAADGGVSWSAWGTGKIEICDAWIACRTIRRAPLPGGRGSGLLTILGPRDGSGTVSAIGSPGGPVFGVHYISRPSASELRPSGGIPVTLSIISII